MTGKGVYDFARTGNRAATTHSPIAPPMGPRRCDRCGAPQSVYRLDLETLCRLCELRGARP